MIPNASSMQRWATLLDLPTELHQRIVKARRNEPALSEDAYASLEGEWKGDISSLSTVAKALTTICQEELFQELRIGWRDNRYAYMQDLSRLDDALRTFCSLLKTAPHISSYISTLQLSVTEKFLQWDSATKDIVETALRQMTMVTKLHLVGYPSNPEDPLYFQRHYEASPQGLVAGVLSIVVNPGFRHLFLDKIAVPVWSLAKSKDLKTLELHDSPCFFWDPESYPPEPLREDPIYLNHLVITKQVSRGLFMTEERRRHCNISLSKLAKLEAPFDPERLALITEQLSVLEVLRLTVNYGPPEYVATTGPLSFLNPLSFATLKELEVNTAFNLAQAEDDLPIILDPYQGLARDRSLLKLTSLRRLKVAISISGKYMEELEFNTRESFGEEWGTLQTVLLPSGDKCPLTSLQEVHLTLICIDEKHNPSMVLVEQFHQRVVLPQLSRLRESQKPRFFCNVERTFSFNNPWGYPNLEPYDVQTISLC